MYFIIQYKSDSDSGIVFVPYEATHYTAMDCVIKSLSLRYEKVSVEIVGFCKTLEISKLSKVEEYAYFEKDSTNIFSRLKREKLPYPIYCSKEVLCYAR